MTLTVISNQDEISLWSDGGPFHGFINTVTIGSLKSNPANYTQWARSPNRNALKVDHPSAAPSSYVLGDFVADPSLRTTCGCA